MAHTFDPANADRLDDVSRYRYCSRDELVAAIDPASGDRVLDLGSGTGFYTADVAPYADEVVGVDVQPAMHRRFREKGVPANGSLVTGEIEALPFRDAVFDAAFSTMTFHEFATPAGLSEIHRVVGPDGRLVTVDWSAAGEGEAGPPGSDRHDADSASALLEEAGFDVTRAEERPETFVAIAVRER